MSKEKLLERYPKYITHNGMRYYSEQEVISGIKIIVERSDGIDHKRSFCREHNFLYEHTVLDNMRQLLGDIRSKLCMHFDLLGRII